MRTTLASELQGEDAARDGRATREAVASEKESHLDGVPQRATSAAVLLDTPSLFNEAELAIQSDRRLVVGEDDQAELMQPLVARPIDRCTHQRLAYTAATPGARHRHGDLAKTEAAHLNVERTDDLPRYLGDE